MADIIYTYIFNIKQFLRIGFRANKVSATFYIICIYYMEKILIVDNNNELRKVESIVKDKL